MRCVFFLVGLLALVGCATKPVTSSVAAAHGASDLGCEYDTTSAYLSERGTWIARGCGGWAEYSCTRPYRAEGGLLLVHSEPAGTAICSKIAVHRPAEQ